MTKILIYNGADANIRSNKGKTPLEMATINGNLQKYFLLLSLYQYVKKGLLFLKKFE